MTGQNGGVGVHGGSDDFRNSYMMKMPFLYLLTFACSVVIAGAFELKAAEAADPAHVNNTQPGMGKESAQMIHQTDLKKVWEDIDRHINPLQADKTYPYYSYHIIDERYYIAVAFVDKEWKLREQWMDVTAYCTAQIPLLQEMGIHVKKAHDILDSITSREEGDAKVGELKETLIKYLDAAHSKMPPHMFPQLREYYFANDNALFERIVNIIRNGSYNSEKLDQFLRDLIP